VATGAFVAFVGVLVGVTAGIRVRTLVLGGTALSRVFRLMAHPEADRANNKVKTRVLGR
jgi:hypothetical protein